MVVTFGEILIRLTPPDYKRISQTTSFEMNIGGAETNTAVLLSQWGIATRLVTKLPQNEIGDLCKKELQKYNVNTKEIAFDNSNTARLGLYFYEKGYSVRPSQVVYDRANSSVSRATLSDFDWDKIFKDTSYFYYTGITPAVSDNLKEILLFALKKAKEKNITVLCDLNYRSKLWNKEKANSVMSECMKYTDILFANTGSVFDVFGIGENKYGEKATDDELASIMREVKEKFSLTDVIFTVRETVSANKNNLYAVSYNKEFCKSKYYSVDILDRIGGGDSFAAGYIYGLINKYSNDYTLEFATAAFVLKHTIQGDFNIVKVDEIESLARGNTSGNVKR